MNLKFFFPVSSLNAIIPSLRFAEISKWRYWIASAIVLIILGYAKQVNGSDFNFNSLNGLFTPTAAEKFFDEGTEKFEQEIRILIKMRDSDFTGDILKIQTEFDESEIPEAIIEPDNFLEKTNF